MPRRLGPKRLCGVLCAAATASRSDPTEVASDSVRLIAHILLISCISKLLRSLILIHIFSRKL